MMTNLITIVDRKHEHWHRSNIIIRDLDNHFIVAEFDSLEQLEFFAKTLGFTYSLDEENRLIFVESGKHSGVAIEFPIRFMVFGSWTIFLLEQNQSRRYQTEVL